MYLECNSEFELEIRVSTSDWWLLTVSCVWGIAGGRLSFGVCYVFWHCRVVRRIGACIGTCTEIFSITICRVSIVMPGGVIPDSHMGARKCLVSRGCFTSFNRNIFPCSTTWELGGINNCLNTLSVCLGLGFHCLWTIWVLCLQCRYQIFTPYSGRVFRVKALISSWEETWLWNLMIMYFQCILNGYTQSSFLAYYEKPRK